VTHDPPASCGCRLTGIVDYWSERSLETSLHQLLSNNVADCDDGCVGSGAEVYLFLQQRIPSLIPFDPRRTRRLGGLARAKSISRKEMTKIGLKGAAARAKKLTPEQRRRIAKKAIAARWARKSGGQ